MLLGQMIMKDGSGDQVFVMGLSKMNLENLKAGRPMRITRETHGGVIPKGWEILILYGETEEVILNGLKEAGLVDDKSEVTGEPERGN